MTFLIERVGRPTGARARRVQRFDRERAVDLLGGRTLWCGGGIEEHLGWARPEGVVTAPVGADLAPSARAGDIVVMGGRTARRSSATAGRMRCGTVSRGRRLCPG